MPSDCAAGVSNFSASSSVSDALNTASMLPKNSTSRLPRVGPRPGVRVKASHESWFELAVGIDGLGSGTVTHYKAPSLETMPPLCIRKMQCQGQLSHVC